MTEAELRALAESLADPENTWSDSARRLARALLAVLDVRPRIFNASGGIHLSAQDQGYNAALKAIKNEACHAADMVTAVATDERCAKCGGHRGWVGHASGHVGEEGFHRYVPYTLATKAVAEPVSAVAADERCGFICVGESEGLRRAAACGERRGAFVHRCRENEPHEPVWFCHTFVAPKAVAPRTVFDTIRDYEKDPAQKASLERARKELDAEATQALLDAEEQRGEP